LAENFELIIVGAGPAGLAAGLYGARMGLNTLVVGEILGGLATEAALIENYPGVEPVTGLELMDRLHRQAAKYGAKIHAPETVLELVLHGEEKKVKTDRNLYSCRAVIIATGCAPKKLGVPGEEKFKGKGVSYCATCDGPFFKDKTVMVVGGGNSAVSGALHLKDLAKKVYLVHRRSQLRADAVLRERLEESGVEILWDTLVKSIEGNGHVARVQLANSLTGEEAALPVDGVFIYVGEAPQSKLAEKAGVRVDGEGFILVNRKQETSLKAVYAAGDVTGNVRQVGVAVGEGITAAVNAYRYLKGG
jgi:thioredoxin reductase (NADPH)